MIELFPYQKEGVSWLSQRTFGLLADEPGIGKTVTAIAAMNLSSGRFIVVCPAIARANWYHHFKNIFGKMYRDVDIYLIKNKKELKDIGPKDSVIISYDLLPQLLIMDTWLAFKYVIIDESHFAKEIKANRTKAVWGKMGICRYGKHVWALSGTPMPNHPGELWPMLYSFGATKLSYEAFIDRYCVCNFDSRYMQTPKIVDVKKEMLPEIREMLGRVSLRRKKTEVLKNLPLLSVDVEYLEPIEPFQDSLDTVFLDDRETYQKFKAKVMEERIELLEKIGAITTMDGDISIRELQALSPAMASIRRYNAILKVKSLAERIEYGFKECEFDSLVVFGIHISAIDFLAIELRLRGIQGVEVLYGKTPNKSRDEIIFKFQNRLGIKVILANIISAGTAITLTEASDVWFLEYDWTPANNIQAMQRCHRIGQDKHVRAKFFSLPDSVDDAITRTVARKTKYIEGVGL